MNTDKIGTTSVSMSKDEQYPVYSAHEQGGSVIAHVPVAKLRAWKRAAERWDEAQAEMESAYNEAVKMAGR